MSEILGIKETIIKTTKTTIKMKCSVCNKPIDTTFLNKVLGTYIKDPKGKLHPVCFECQKKFSSKEEILKAIK